MERLRRKYRKVRHKTTNNEKHKKINEYKTKQINKHKTITNKKKTINKTIQT